MLLSAISVWAHSSLTHIIYHGRGLSGFKLGLNWAPSGSSSLAADGRLDGLSRVTCRCRAGEGLASNDRLPLCQTSVFLCCVFIFNLSCFESHLTDLHVYCRCQDKTCKLFSHAMFSFVEWMASGVALSLGCAFPGPLSCLYSHRSRGSAVLRTLAEVITACDTFRYWILIQGN